MNGYKGMTALITGASSGIGAEFARVLDGMGIKLVLSARNTEALNRLNDELDNVTAVIPADLSKRSEAIRLYKEASAYCPDIIINNAGYGIYGEFVSTKLSDELDLINVNVTSVHILTKLFLRDLVKRNKGYILNVSSSAAFLSGPLLSSYYASKNYVQRLSEAIRAELKHRHSRVYIGTLCPGPVDTGFNARAGLSAFKLFKGQSAEFVARYAVERMFRREFLILPHPLVGIGLFLRRFAPERIAEMFVMFIQKSKE